METPKLWPLAHRTIKVDGKLLGRNCCLSSSTFEVALFGFHDGFLYLVDAFVRGILGFGAQLEHFSFCWDLYFDGMLTCICLSSI